VPSALKTRLKRSGTANGRTELCRYAEEQFVRELRTQSISEIRLTWSILHGHETIGEGVRFPADFQNDSFRRIDDVLKFRKVLLPLQC